MNKQGSWTRWDSVQERALTWQNIWSMEGHWIKFLLPSCTLCGRPANLEHVLSSCRSSLADGKFWWRHDQILTQLAAGVEQARKKPKQLSKGPRFIHFLKAGECSSRDEVQRGPGHSK
ncbi:hypothetical protein N1851_012857 [Merluccius polli]|uniref:Reverse transcriptase zinc-binding domain-containing protein n=1 Tax=Merluccius polli TaxID=89951 RepID=A0AA47P5R1_MERPO|nr:hypothetical protein N1851_012857 [Merluccius polli]